MSQVELRAVEDGDLDAFFAHLQDPVARRMAAFVGKDSGDRRAFDARWARIRSDPGVTVRTITLDGGLAGHVASFRKGGDLEVTYWVERETWGRGVASSALRLFLEFMTERPLHGRAAKDNRASIRVLEKCGFQQVGEERGFANARGEEIDEVVMRLDAPR